MNWNNMRIELFHFCISYSLISIAKPKKKKKNK